MYIDRLAVGEEEEVEEKEGWQKESDRNAGKQSGLWEVQAITSCVNKPGSHLLEAIGLEMRVRVRSQGFSIG